MVVAMHITENDLAVVRSILRRCLPVDVQVMAYGSRVHGRNLKPFSDLDLCLKARAEIPAQSVTELRHSFEDSELPFKVDVVEWSRLSDEFRAVISGDLELLPVYVMAQATT